MEIWEPKPSGTVWATPALLRDSFNLDGRAFGRPRCGWFGFKYEIAVDLKNVDCVGITG
jgi:hypothetical protein